MSQQLPWTIDHGLWTMDEYKSKHTTTMKILLTALLSLAFISLSAQKKIPGESTWMKLFNGKDLDDWKVKIKDHPLNENFGETFYVEDGILKVKYDEYESFNKQYGHIYYEDPFSYYLLVVEYRFVGEQARGGEGWALRNSGAMLHCQDPSTIEINQDFPICLEMQFLGGNGKDPRSTANLCTPGTNVEIDNKLFTPHCINSKSKTYHGDRWVRAEALVFGDSIIHHIVEGDTVFTYQKPQYDGQDPWVKKAALRDGTLIKEGFISLQSESHPVEFRKVMLFDLQPYMSDQRRLAAVLKKLKSRKGEK
jgi:hypothetical protein